ncbi:hypothetical protein QTH91_22385 [Variovorax dokdonensis]|uniref:Prokaryotic STING domain-containing protein n=1 Tax=Variovorax dokdonensis TaxID=344883 RepID=A0ABT7NH63_9BURK|nr:STING domain-containing protein [Variovorax dokdonensis]MDM0047258.1 hypothetical protein [Variovorax dokdonensis]
MEKPRYRDYLKLLWQRFRGRGLITAVLATVAFALAVSWAFTGDGTFEPWANLATVCAAIAGVLATVWASMQNRVDTGNQRDRYSLSYALAYGYVHNFLVGAVDALKAEPNPGKIYVYRPSSLAQLDPASHEVFKTVLAQRGFELSSRTLDKSSNRPRGILSVYLPAKPTSPVHFVDFPTTLLTLSSLINYQAARAEEEDGEAWSDKYRDEMARTYIEHFFREMSTQADKAGIREWIDFTDSNFKNL